MRGSGAVAPVSEAAAEIDGDLTSLDVHKFKIEILQCARQGGGRRRSRLLAFNLARRHWSGLEIRALVRIRKNDLAGLKNRGIVRVVDKLLAARVYALIKSISQHREGGGNEQKHRYDP